MGTSSGKGVRFAVFGLIAGIIVGAGILVLKRYLLSELLAVLDDEVRASCDCRLEVGSASLSLLRLSAVAQDARIISRGETALGIDTIKVRFGLRHILQREVVLSQLELIGADARGVLAESETYRFIDHLTAPAPPDSPNAPAVSVKLLALTLTDSRFTESIGESVVVGDGVQMSVLRDARDNFILLPHIDELKLRLPPNETGVSDEILLGDVASKIVLRDGEAEFQSLKLQFGSGSFAVRGFADLEAGNALRGTGDFYATPRLLKLPEELSLFFKGDGELGGTLEEPEFSGTLHSWEGHPSVVTIGDVPLLMLDSSFGTFRYQLRDRTSRLTIDRLSASGPTGMVTLAEPLQLVDDVLHSRFRIAIGSLPLGAATLQDVSADTLVDGPIGRTDISAEGNVESVLVGPYTLPSFSYQVHFEDAGIRIKMADRIAGGDRFTLNGFITTDGRVPELDLRYSLRDLPVLQAALSPDTAPSLLLSGSGTVRGPIDPSRLETDAELVVTSQHFRGESALQGTVTGRRGTITAQLFNESKSLRAELALDTAKAHGKLDVVLSEFRPREYDPELDCLMASLTGSYAFSLDDPAGGDGAVQLEQMRIGCGASRTALTAPQSLEIRDGTIRMPPLTFSNRASEFVLEGTASSKTGLNIGVSGTLDLASLLPLMPAVDDMRGMVDAELTLRGFPGEFSMSGTASVRQGEVAVESAMIGASSINGTVSVSDDRILLDDLRGVLNGGIVQVQGEIFPFRFQESSIRASFEGISFEPVENSSVMLSADLHLSANDLDQPLVSGAVLIEHAEIRRDLDLGALIREIPAILFSRGQHVVRSMGDAPSLELDLQVEAGRNVFIVTTWLGAELQGDLHVTGPMAAPRIAGRLTVLSGWFGLRDRRFEITSGSVRFDPSSGEPMLDIVSETIVRSRAGDTVLVVLEATGSLASPRVTLTSDRGLSQTEILSLISSSGTIGAETLANVAGREIALESMQRRDDSSHDLTDFFRRLTTIDTIAIEPALNARRGVVEPTLIARKRILGRLSAVGQTFLGEGGDDARVLLQYDLTRALALSAGADTLSSEENTALGVDLTYTVWAEQQQAVIIRVQGNRAYSRREILRQSRLAESSRIPFAELDRVARSVEEFYRSQGYREATVQAACQVRGDTCSQLELDIDEGPLYRVGAVEVEGDAPAEIVGAKRLRREVVNEPASQALLEHYRDRFIRNLRSEGYISARVRASYEQLDKERVLLRLFLQAGRPVSFSFHGNRAFSADEFLETIRLFSRRQPFGRNTIKILVENMERKYREAGYLFATIRWEENVNEQTGRIEYVISIREEHRVRVESVSFEGNDSMPRDLLLNKLAARFGRDVYVAVHDPKYVVAEQLDANVRTIRELYIEEGFPEVRVTYRIRDGRTPETQRIVYTIEEGPELTGTWLEVAGLPADLDVSWLPSSPYSIPQANRYLNRILSLLAEHGYFRASFSSILSRNDRRLLVTFEPGPATIIGDVRIEGASRIPEHFVRETVRLQPGDPWDAGAIREAKLRLLRQGLFSRVDVEPADGRLDGQKEALVVTVRERPLRTLEVGGGANSELGLHIFGEATEKSFFRDGRSIGLRFDTYYDEAEAEVSTGVASLRYTDPEFLGTPFVHSEALRFQRLDLSTLEFDLDRVSLSSNFFRTLDEELTFSLGHTILREHLDNVSPDAVLSDLDTGSVDLSFVTGSLTLDRRDNPLIPSDGFSVGLDTALAAEAIGGDADYFSVGGRAAILLPFQLLRVPFTLGLNGRAASAWTFGSTSDIPISQRYYIGGRNTVRGFRENSLGPRGEEGSVLGGDLLLLSNAELQHRLNDYLALHLFVDAGSVFLKDRGISIDDVRESAGFGLRYLSPVGPIGFDIGHPLDERQGEPSVRFHFAIGSTF